MKKLVFTLTLLTVTVLGSICAYAGSWQKDHIGWWYKLSGGGYYANTWYQDSDGKWYYFNTNAPQDTYVWDANAFKWNYLNNSQRPYGSMYAGEQTPDGYTVDASGAWN